MREVKRERQRLSKAEGSSSTLVHSSNVCINCDWTKRKTTTQIPTSLSLGKQGPMYSRSATTVSCHLQQPPNGNAGFLSHSPR